MLFDAARSVLLLIDMQDRLLAVCREPDLVVANCVRLVRAAKRLAVPILASEHYPKGLGRTVEPLTAVLGDVPLIEKIHFSCAADAEYRRCFGAFGRDQVVVAGIETHVCVLQTAIGFKQSGQTVAVVGDAVTSRRSLDRDLAFERLRGEGVQLASTEMILFEWLGQGGTSAFKDVFALIR